MVSTKQYEKSIAKVFVITLWPRFRSFFLEFTALLSHSNGILAVNKRSLMASQNAVSLRTKKIQSIDYLAQRCISYDSKK